MTEISSSSLIDEMYTEAIRLKTFKDWPFGEDSKCSAPKMAEAGFFHCPTELEPDVVQCYVCFKELDGWEENDDPWEEHFSHSKICLFAKLRKPQKNLTVAEIYEIEAERKVNKCKSIAKHRMQNFRLQCEATEDLISQFTENTKERKK